MKEPRNPKISLYDEDDMEWFYVLFSFVMIICGMGIGFIIGLLIR